MMRGGVCVGGGGGTRGSIDNFDGRSGGRERM